MLFQKTSAGLLLTLTILAAIPVMASANHEGYVGGQACSSCHEQQSTAWQGSHHDLAMQLPTPQAVLGNFDDAQFTAAGTTTRFYRDNGRYMIRTDGPDGELESYAVSYTFGVSPLQQYLIALPGGRLQAFGIAWDSRPKQAGGQRWFHLYPDDIPRSGDRLHWTAINQNWNHMCAECHSTDLQKRFDATTNTYNTSYAEIDVSCEACHGPGAEHIEWAKQPERDNNPQLEIRLNERHGVSWLNNPENGKPQRSAPLTSSFEIDTCARCHSRRGRLANDYQHGKPLGDFYRLATLEAGLYHPDGQILDEVFVHGSFLQSRMHAAGVTCSDCHNPHSLDLRLPGDATCLSCHSVGDYAIRTHHHHDPTSSGARCVNCHMPEVTYMVVDPRRDHSFRVPRPDLTTSIGVPNACNSCHTDQTAAWATSQIETWTENKPAIGYQQHGTALFLAAQGAPQSRDALIRVVRDTRQSAMARASAITALGQWLDSNIEQVVSNNLTDTSPLVRRSAVQTLTATPLPVRAKLLSPLLRDPVREVRLAAVLALADLPPGTLTPSAASAYSQGLAEYLEMLALDADRPEAHVNLGVLLTRRKDITGAEAAYQKALQIEPGHEAAVVNLVDLYRATDREAQGGALLTSALVIRPDAADIHHVYGLWLVRQRRAEQALAALTRAAELAPEVARYGYVLAVALHGQNQVQSAFNTLDRVLQRHPYDVQSLSAAVYWRRQSGRDPGEYGRRLMALQNLSREN
ncbi:MAG: HEAT repeat domain-containing protein [Pseudomonadaceae bacterium]|nr:HEAT repeat domain-containing protein [Pseudomonadaceae bacterium]